MFKSPEPAFMNVVDVVLVEPIDTVFEPAPVPKLKPCAAEPVPMLTSPANVLFAILTGVYVASVAILIPATSPPLIVTFD